MATLPHRGVGGALQHHLRAALLTSMYWHLYGLAESSELDSESDSDMIWLKLRVSDHRAAEYCAQALLDEQSAVASIEPISSVPTSYCQGPSGRVGALAPRSRIARPGVRGHLSHHLISGSS